MWHRSEVPRVLFLGMCLDFYYSLLRVLLPQFGFHLGWGSVSQALVESYLVPPCHPLERRDFYLDKISPPASMDEFTSCEGPLTFSARALSFQSPPVPVEAVIPCWESRSL